MSKQLRHYANNVELVLFRDVFDGTCETFTGANVHDVLGQAFDDRKLPKHLRLYLNELNADNDITDASTDYIAGLQGRLIMVCYPADPVTVAIVSVIISVAATFLLMPPIPDVDTSATSAPSASNSLSSRKNPVRIGERVQDGLGTNLMTPDHIAPPYVAFIEHEEVEYSYMCQGVGEYDQQECYEGTTPVTDIPAMRVDFYAPDENHINGSPSQSFGAALTTPELVYRGLVVKQHTGVKEQDLPAPDIAFFNDKPIVFQHPNKITILDDSIFTGAFAAGETLIVEGADGLTSQNSLPDIYDLNGEYSIATVTDKTITLTSPELVNSDWTTLTTNTDTTDSADITLSKPNGDTWSPWFNLTQDDAQGFYLNIMGNLHATDGSTHTGLYVEFGVEYQSIDIDNTPTGTVTSNTILIETKAAQKNGSVYVKSSDDRQREPVKQSYKFAHTGRCRVRIKRNTKRWEYKGWNNVQQLKLVGLYSYRHMTADDAPADCTTLFVKTRATDSALAQKEREIRVMAQRKLMNWQNSDALMLSNRVDDILYHIMRAPHLWNYPAEYIDMPQIKAEVDAMFAYFLDARCVEFNGVFDSKNQSPEEMGAIIANTCFSELYRLGNKLRLYFERPQPFAMVQFTSYNMLPNSFESEIVFGRKKDYDGVQATWRNKADGSPQDKKYPLTCTNPQKIELFGINNELQATVHLMRQYQRNLHSRKTIKFDGMDESNIIIRRNRINVADITRADVQEGQIENIDVVGSDIVATLSDPVSFDDLLTYMMYVQQTDGQVDKIAVTAGADAHHVVLDRLPAATVSHGTDAVVSASYQIISSVDDDKRDSYIVMSKSPASQNANTIDAISYSDALYAHDLDHIS